MQNVKFKIVAICYLLIIFALFLYSYTQVDLNLTLGRASVFQTIEKSFQYIGWFNRPLSTYIFIAILLLLIISYWFVVKAVRSNKISSKQFWFLTIALSIILLFSYNAFSYDLFNYMFDARIVTLHHQNPYEHKALDYLSDPWINFMRWTHRVYPYGPTWLLLTVPLSFIGLQFFLPTLFLFKALMAGSFLLSIYFIGKILEEVSPKQKLLGMALFAFNPLVITETLVSAHHDIVMMALVLMSFYLLLKKRFLLAIILFLLSIGIKFATILLLPVFLYILYKKVKGQSVSSSSLRIFSIGCMVIAVVLASIRTELQPWYLIWILPFLSFLPFKNWIFWISTIVSFGLLLQYIPFLYTGNWDPPIPSIKLAINVITFTLLSCIVIYNLFKEKGKLLA